MNVLKLDAGTETMFQLINRPAGNLTLNKLVEYLKRFDRDELIIQTLFLRGEYNGQTIDNTTPYEVEAWQQLVREINPHRVMVYSIDRATPAKNLEQIGREELSQIVSGLSDSNMQIDIY